MRQVSSHRSAFERQLTEAVLIKKYNGPLLLNSKLEYSRCYIPKITMKIGNKENNIDPQKKKEKSKIEKIKMLYKKENKRQKERDGNDEIEEDSGAKKKSKRRKVEAQTLKSESNGTLIDSNGTSGTLIDSNGTIEIYNYRGARQESNFDQKV